MKTVCRVGLLSCLMLFVSCLLSSCDEKMMDYEGPESLYMNAKSGESNLMMLSGDTIDYTIKVLTTGKIYDYDRPYQFIATENSTAVAGTDYILPQGGVMAAGEYESEIHVKLLKNDKLLTERVNLTIRLVPNEHFTTDFPKPEKETDTDLSSFMLTFTSIMEEPYWWPYYDESTKAENGNMGFFTVKKISMMNELYGMTYADWLEGNGMTTTRVQYIYMRFAKYLIQQYRNHDPLLEDDGRLMWVTGCPWTSVIGEPWDGTFNESY